jgi:hypothetical protein
MSAEIEDQIPAKNALAGIGRAVLWLAGSALFGSVALVLWNRRALRSLRDAEDVPVVETPRPRDDDGIY